MRIMTGLREPSFLWPANSGAGGMRGAINPKDGMFYAVGSDGWGNYALEDGSLDRIRYTGKSLPMLENVHGYENGIELKFSSKVKVRPLRVPKAILFSNGITNIPPLTVLWNIQSSVPRRRGTTVSGSKM